MRVAVAERENAILIPQRAVQELQGAKTVLVVDNENRAQVRSVSLGDQSDKFVIVLQGLTAGEKVIVEGMQKVRPGGQVNPSAATNETARKNEGS